MNLLSSIEESDSLLLAYPRIREKLVTIAAEKGGGKATPVEDWKPLLEFLRLSDRSPEEIAIATHAAERAATPQKLDPGLISDVLAILEDALIDIKIHLTERLGHAYVPEGFVALDSELNEYLSTPTARKRDERIRIVREFIYDHPGHYMLRIHSRLAQDDAFRFSYEALRSYVRELEERGDILTVGDRQGVPRFCFPHPAKVRDRHRYFGQLFGINGSVENRLTDLFEPISATADIFLVNHHMPPVLLVVPFGTDLMPSERLEGFGVLQPVEMLKKRMQFIGDQDFPRSANAVLVATHLSTLGGSSRRIPIDEKFSAAFMTR